MAAHTVLGSLVVIEHLCRGRGGASRETFARTVRGDGAEVVERCLLAPLGGEEHGDCFWEVAVGRLCGASNGLAFFHILLHHLADSAEPPLEALVPCLVVEAALRIAEHGRNKVVIGDDGKSAVVVSEDCVIVCSLELLHWRFLSLHHFRQLSLTESCRGCLHLLL